MTRHDSPRAASRVLIPLLFYGFLSCSDRCKVRVPCGYGSQLEASPLLEVKGVSKRHTGNYISTGAPWPTSL